MKKNGKDILADHEMKKMPYCVPEGYFDSFRSQMKPAYDNRNNSRHIRLSPYFAMAAMLILLITGGTFLLRHAAAAEEFTQEDFILFSNNLTNAIYYEEAEQYAEADIADEEIIEYLIYSGITAEEIELSK